MRPEQIHNDRDGEPFADKEQTRTAGYVENLKAQRAKTRKEDRVNEAAARVLKRLKIDPPPVQTRKPKEPDLFGN